MTRRRPAPCFGDFAGVRFLDTRISLMKVLDAKVERIDCDPEDRTVWLVVTHPRDGWPMRCRVLVREPHDPEVVAAWARENLVGKTLVNAQCVRVSWPGAWGDSAGDAD